MIALMVLVWGNRRSVSYSDADLDETDNMSYCFCKSAIRKTRLPAEPESQILQFQKYSKCSSSYVFVYSIDRETTLPQKKSDPRFYTKAAIYGSIDDKNCKSAIMSL